MASSTSADARHAKTISVGNAAALFGAPAGEDDFFGGLASKPPAFDDIGEADETAEEDAGAEVASHQPVAISPAREVAADLFGGGAAESADWLAAAPNGHHDAAATGSLSNDTQYGHVNGYAHQEPPALAPESLNYDDDDEYEQAALQGTYQGGSEQPAYDPTPYTAPAVESFAANGTVDPYSASHHQQPAYDDAQYAYYPPSDPAAQPLPVSAQSYGSAYDPYAAPAINRTASPYSVPPPDASYGNYAVNTAYQPPPGRTLSPPLPPPPTASRVAPYPRTGAYSPPPPKQRAVTSPHPPSRKARQSSPPAVPVAPAPPPPLPRPQSAAPPAESYYAQPAPPPRRASSAMSHHAQMANARKDSLPSMGQALYGAPTSDDAYSAAPPPRRASMASPPPTTARARSPAGIPLPSSPPTSLRHAASPPPEFSLSPPSPLRSMASPPPQLAVSPPSPEFAAAGPSAEAWGSASGPPPASISPTPGYAVLADLEGPPTSEHDTPVSPAQATFPSDPYGAHESYPAQTELYDNEAYSSDPWANEQASPYGAAPPPAGYEQEYGEQEAVSDQATDSYQRHYDSYGQQSQYGAPQQQLEPSYNDYGSQGGQGNAYDPYAASESAPPVESMTYAQYRHQTQGSVASSTDESAGGSFYGEETRSRSASGSTSQSYADDAETPHGTRPPTEYNYGQYGGYPQPTSHLQRTASPAAMGAHPPPPPPSSYGPSTSSYDPYAAPSHDSTYAPPPPQSTYEPAYDPYAQSTQDIGRSPYGEHSEPAAPSVETLTRYSPPVEDNGYGPAAQLDTAYLPTAADRSATASPSAFVARPGGPDPLGRDRKTVPIISLGFGGKLVTCFPASNFSTFSAVPPTMSIRTLLEPSTDEETFPGPLYLDPGWNKAMQLKKRKEVLAWLDQRIEEREKAAKFVAAAGGDDAEVKAHWAADRAVLLRLLKTLVEGDGKLSGSAQLDEAARLAILPQAKDDAPLPTAADLHQGAFAMTSGTGPVVSTSSVHESDLDQLQASLARGDRTGAMRRALDRKLWGHALVIASSLGKEAWREAVTELIRSDLASATDANESNGRESLRVAYSLFAGMSGSATYEFSPSAVSAQLRTFNPPAASPAPNPKLTPALNGPGSVVAPSRTGTPFSGLAAPPQQLSSATLSKWRETAATIVANRVSGDLAALVVLGDTLAANGWIDAAHCCYLLSSPSSHFGGLGQPGAKLVLLGVDLAATPSALSADSEAIALTEIVEFALSLVPTVKGQEAFAGLPHLQAYRLAQASRLADLGFTSRSQRYCEAIGGTLKLATKMSPYYHPALVEQVKYFSERLVGVPTDKSGSWFPKAIQRPKLDSLWSTLEDRVSKFVAGEGEAEHPHGPNANATVLHGGPGAAVAAKAVGPFSHYSSISPASTNATVSRASSHSDLGGTAAAQSAVPFTPVAPPPRPTSASQRGAAARSTKPPPPVVTPRHGHKKSMSMGYLAYGSDPYAGSTPKQMPPSFYSSGDVQEVDETPRARPHSFDQPERPSMNEDGDGGWWGAASGYAGGGGGDDSTAQFATLRAPTFAPVSESLAEDESGFISPMGAMTPSLNASTSSLRNYSPVTRVAEDDDEDLGFGNSRSKRESASESDATGKVASSSQTDAAQRPAMKQSASSWGLSRWFKREASPAPGSIKANMGEESSFVYDPVEKRWVNKKAGAVEAAPAAAPAPPPRAQTVSPMSSMRTERPPRFMSATPPPMPNRATSAAPPPPAPISAAPTPPPPSASAPPTQRKVTAPAKKGGRRYVDVM